MTPLSLEGLALQRADGGRWVTIGRRSTLVWAIGAGAELRPTLGTAVFFGMIGVTALGLIFTPIFYVICRCLTNLRRMRRPQVAAPAE